VQTSVPPLHPSALQLPLCVAALALQAASAVAQGGGGVGDFLIAPTRVVFEGRQRTAEITLVNTGSRTATYRISFIQLRMGENGGTSEIQSPGPGERFADSLIRYSPRQVVLEPNVAQAVRMQLRMPADLPPGEYRSHLLFRAVPPAEPVERAVAPTPTLPQEVGVRLTPIFGVSIPVIVRHGETSATVTLSDLEVVPPSAPEETPTLRFRMNRTGNRSVYGDVTATLAPAGGRPLVVGVANGIAVYTPNAVRVVSVALRLPPATSLRAGVLRVTYAEREPRRETIAEAELQLP
jgi:P pilus assembly chaperone PapD